MNVDIIKKVQQVQLEMLVLVDRICDKHNLKYQLFAGTLLGAVRHNGFIPWDDDIDIALSREDYEKLLKILPSELPKQYFLQNISTDKNTFNVFTKLRKENTTFIEALTKNTEMHQGIFIDIFPMDKVILENSTIKKHKRRLKKLFILKIIKNKMVSHNNGIFKKILKKLIVLILTPILYFVSNEKIICKIDQESKKFQFTNSESYSHLTNGVGKDRYEKFIYNKEDWEDTFLIDFEGYKLPISKNYDKILTQIYGDYLTLPKIEDRVGSHGVLISIDNRIYYELNNGKYNKR